MPTMTIMFMLMQWCWDCRPAVVWRGAWSVRSHRCPLIRAPYCYVVSFCMPGSLILKFRCLVGSIGKCERHQHEHQSRDSILSDPRRTVTWHSWLQRRRILYWEVECSSELRNRLNVMKYAIVRIKQKVAPDYRWPKPKWERTANIRLKPLSYMEHWTKEALRFYDLQHKTE